MKWWITAPDGGTPIGPVTTDVLVRGLLSGRVPKHVLICAQGESRWRGVGDVPEFLAALETTGNREDLEDAAEFVDAELVDEFDDDDEHTQVDRRPFRPSDPPPSGLHRFEDIDEQTVVDAPPFLDSSEPPPV